jgi:5-methyltetrahydrofolate--homocysteine methyltransferase
MGIVNPGMLQVYDDIEPTLREKLKPWCSITSATAAEELVEFAATLKQHENVTTKHDDWRKASVERRLAYALLKGLPTIWKRDIAEARTKYSPSLAIIEGPLMGGMSEIGTLFGQGKMFLPQVVKISANHEKSGFHS